MVSHECTQGPQLEKFGEDIAYIKETLSKVAELLTKQAVADEKLKVIEKQLDDIEKRLRSVEVVASQNTWAVSRGERLFWILVAAAVALFKGYGGGGT